MKIFLVNLLVMLGMATICTQQAHAVILPTDIIGWYVLDGDAQDSSGNNNHGVNSNATFVVDGVRGTVASFNGTNGSIDVSATGVSITERPNFEFSTAFWFKPAIRQHINANSTPDVNVIMGAPGSGVIEVVGEGSWSGMGGSGAYGGIGLNSGGGAGSTSKVPAINVYDGNWHHVVMQWVDPDGTQAGNTGADATVYIDGILANDVNGNTYNGNSGQAIPSMKLGGPVVHSNGGSADKYYQGLMSDTLFFNRQLTPDEITQAMNYAPGPLHVAGQNNIGKLLLSGTEVPTGDPVQGVQVVRVSRTPGDFISLREMEVIDTNNVNVGGVSQGATPQASSLWNGGGPHPIAALNDEITNDLGNGAHAHTGNSPLPTEYLQVTLNGAHDIDSVHLYNRGNCCPNQAQGLLLELFSDPAATNLLASFPNVGVPGSQGSDNLVPVGTIARNADLGGGSYILEIDANTLENDMIMVDDNGVAMTMLDITGATLILDVINGDLTDDQTFMLLQADVIKGQLAELTLPDLARGSWDVSNLTVDGTVSFVGSIPEPATATLAMLGLGGLLLRRRRAA